MAALWAKKNLFHAYLTSIALFGDDATFMDAWELFEMKNCCDEKVYDEKYADFYFNIERKWIKQQNLNF